MTGNGLVVVWRTPPMTWNPPCVVWLPWEGSGR